MEKIQNKNQTNNFNMNKILDPKWFVIDKEISNNGLTLNPGNVISENGLIIFEKDKKKRKELIKQLTETTLKNATEQNLQTLTSDDILSLIKKNIKKYSLNLFIENKEEIAEKLYNINPFFYAETGFFWFWNKQIKCYDRKNDMEIMLIIKECASHKGFQVTKNNFWTETLRSLKLIGTDHKPEPFNKDWIQFKDKIINYKTKELIEPDPKYFNANPIPWRIGEDKETPKIDKLLTEWVGPDNLITLKETLGFCMIQDYPLHRIVCLFGSGLNGKGCFLRFLDKLIGDRNICSSNLNKLIGSNFELSKLHNKLACMVGETNFGEIKDTSILKQLSGQDLISAEFKGKDSFDYYNHATLFIASNSLPISLDVTDGFFRRWLIIDFSNKFKEGPDPVKDIPDVEYENLCNQIVNLLPDLMSRGVFHNDGDIKHRRLKYEEKSSPLSIFMKEVYVKDHLSEVPFFEFYDDFIFFCKERGFRELTKNNVSKLLVEHYGIDKERKDVKVNGEWKKWAYLYGLRKVSIGNGGVSTSSTRSTAISSQDSPRENGLEPSVERVESVGGIQKSIQVEEIVDRKCIIDHKCFYCNLTPCTVFDTKGRPICEFCEKDPNIEVENNGETN